MNVVDGFIRGLIRNAIQSAEGEFDDARRMDVHAWELLVGDFVETKVWEYVVNSASQDASAINKESLQLLIVVIDWYIISY